MKPKRNAAYDGVCRSSYSALVFGIGIALSGPGPFLFGANAASASETTGKGSNNPTVLSRPSSGSKSAFPQNPESSAPPRASSADRQGPSPVWIGHPTLPASPWRNVVVLPSFLQLSGGESIEIEEINLPKSLGQVWVEEKKSGKIYLLQKGHSSLSAGDFDAITAQAGEAKWLLIPRPSAKSFAEWMSDLENKKRNASESSHRSEIWREMAQMREAISKTFTKIGVPSSDSLGLQQLPDPNLLFVSKENGEIQLTQLPQYWSSYKASPVAAAFPPELRAELEEPSADRRSAPPTELKRYSPEATSWISSQLFSDFFPDPYNAPTPSFAAGSSAYLALYLKNISRAFGLLKLRSDQFDRENLKSQIAGWHPEPERRRAILNSQRQGLIGLIAALKGRLFFPGETIQGPSASGEWRIEKILSSGGEAVVYEVTQPNPSDPQYPKRKALRVTTWVTGSGPDGPPRFRIDASSFEEFQNNLIEIRKLQSPHLIGVEGTQVTSSILQTAAGPLRHHETILELGGKTLRELTAENARESGPKAFFRRLEMGVDVLSSVVHGLADLQKMDPRSGLEVVHQDIKPQNIVEDLLAKGKFKILDYGTLTKGASPLNAGTEGYRAPESYRIEQRAGSAAVVPVTRVSDLYSLSQTLLSALGFSMVVPADQPLPTTEEWKAQREQRLHKAFSTLQNEMEAFTGDLDPMYKKLLQIRLNRLLNFITAASEVDPAERRRQLTGMLGPNLDDLNQIPTTISPNARNYLNSQPETPRALTDERGSQLDQFDGMRAGRINSNSGTDCFTSEISTVVLGVQR